MPSGNWGSPCSSWPFQPCCCLGISIFIPKQFITLFFSAKLATAASAFAPLVVAMIFLAISVLLTNYLFGAGRRWIVIVLAVGAALSVGPGSRCARESRGTRPRPI